MKKIAYIKVASVAVAILSAVSCSKDNKNEQQETPVVDVATPVVDSVTIYNTYPGYLTAIDKVDLVARVNGYLTSHPYQSGAFVRKGTVLYTIESAPYVDAVNSAKARLADAEATYEYAVKNYQAMQKAYVGDAVSQMEMLQSKSSMEAAKAAISNAQSDLASACTTLSYCTVRAPFDGRVSKSNYSQGAYLAGAGSPVTLGTIYDDSTVKANFSIDDAELIGLLKEGVYTDKGADLRRLPVTFSDSLTYAYTADLTYLAPAIDVSTGQMQVQATIQNSYGELRQGMVVNIKVPAQVVPDGLLVLDESISRDRSGSYVYVVNDSNKAVYTPVKTGDLVTPTLRLVTSGLKRDDRYVTKAMLKVRDGMTVQPQMTTPDK